MKTYLLENFGEIGEANLTLGVEEVQGTHWSELNVGESTFIRIRGTKAFERLTRTK